MIYRKIFTQIWQDEKFQRLDSDSQILFFYVLTSPHSNAIGLYYLPEPYIQADLRWNKERVSKGLTKLLQGGLISYDKSSKLILVTNFLKYNPIDNKNLLICAIKILQALPKSPLISHYKTIIEPLIKQLGSSYPSPFEAPTIAPPDSEAVTEAVTEAEEESPRESASTPDFITQLKEIYTWVDVDTEIQKMKGHLLTPKAKGRKLTKAFAVRWLNRVDKPIEEITKNTQLKQQEDKPPEWIKEAVKEGWKT